MATWVDPIDSQTDPDAPITSDLAKRWDNNVIAVAEGAAGAPKISDAAMGSAATNDGRDWVNNRAALSQVGGVGTYATLLINANSQPANPGAVLNGSQLRYSGGSGSSGSAPTGQWRLMGYLVGTESSLWLRIS